MLVLIACLLAVLTIIESIGFAQSFGRGRRVHETASKAIEIAEQKKKINELQLEYWMIMNEKVRNERLAIVIDSRERME